MGYRGERTNECTALCIAVLMVLSTIAVPGVASGSTAAPAAVEETRPVDQLSAQDQGPPGTDDPDDEWTVPAYIENATFENAAEFSPLEQRVWVRTRLGGIEPSDRQAERELSEAVAAVEGSLSAHVDWYRLDEDAPFGADREALQSLRRVDATGVENVSAALVSADRGVAQRAIADAEYVFETFGEEVETPGQRTKAREQLKNARQALERGDDHRGGDLQDRRRAIKQYGQAWTHAQTAIDTVREEVGLSLSLSAGQHEPGEETISYPISGAVTGPDANVGTVDVLVDGEYYATVNVSTSTAPGAPERFETELELPTTEATVTVVATDEATGEEVTRTVTVSAPGFADEVYDIELTDPDSAVSVTVTGEGIVESEFDIDVVEPATDRPFQAGPFLHLRNDTAFETATVEIPIEDDPDGEQPAVYTWDQHDEEPWHRVESEVADGVATAEVNSFSWFSVFWVDNWNDLGSRTATLEERHIAEEANGTVEPIDIAFVLDTSGSMGGDRIRNARAASKRFVGSLYEDDRAAVVSFASSATLEQPLTTGREAVNASIDALSARGSTNTGDGLRTAIDELVDNGDADEQSIILLADGGTNTGPDPVSIAEQADDEGITINTIGVGTGIDAAELTDIADATGGDFYQVEDSEDLPEVFDRIEQERIALVDSDDDGLPDAIEEMALPLPFGGPDLVGAALGLDPGDEDSADDGRLDGNVIDIEWVTFEEDGEPKVTAKVVDAIFLPGTGEAVTREVIKIGYFLPTEADPETEDPVTSAVIDRASGDGYAIAPRDDDVPADRLRHDWPWFFDDDPSWLPDDVVDADKYHMQLEPFVVVQHTHAVETDDLPDSYGIDFGGSGVHVYDGSREFSYDSGFSRTELVVAAPSGTSDLVTSAYSSIGRSEVTVDMTDTELGREVTATSEYRYIYDTDAAERYEPVYNEAWNLFEQGMTASFSLSTAPTRWAAMRAADSMTQKNLIRAINNADKILKVVDSEDETGYDDMQSDIYEEFGVDEELVVGTGPVIAIDLTDYDLED